MSRYRDLSLWMDQVDDDLTPRAPLDGDRKVDVAIAGGGYTALWTAYYLRKADPSLDIAIVERDICGFGASGRNGGWCSALFAASKEKIARRYGAEAAVAMQRAMFDTVDEVGKVVETEGISCDFHKGGTLAFATIPAHIERLKQEVEGEREWGFGEPDLRWLEKPEADARLKVDGGLGAAFTPHCARLQPASLARGLARVVERMGVSIYEQTTVTSIEPRRLKTDRGTLTASVVVRALEGYTPELSTSKRALIPLYSLMVATEPLGSSFFDEVGWDGRETVTDGRYLLIYAQRTADDRIAFGGRGAPYHFASSIDPAFDREEKVFSELRRTIVGLWPQLSDVRITHRWGGPLGAPRDWFSSVGLERETGLAWAGGYVGDGVSTTNLAGRTLAALITEQQSELTGLPWVGHRSRLWEPEPLRWIGANLALRAMASADRIEVKKGKPARRAALIGRLIGI